MTCHLCGGPAVRVAFMLLGDDRLTGSFVRKAGFVLPGGAYLEDNYGGDSGRSTEA